MNTKEQIKNYIASQPEAKRSDLQALHNTILSVMPDCKLWFLDGKDETGKIVSNPNIGYGTFKLKYADGTSRAFYQIGLSANTTGISIYIMGIKDRKYLATAFGNKIGKASVTGYCIKLKKLSDIKLDILNEAIRFGIDATSEE